MTLYDHITGGYEYTIVFLNEPGDVAMLESDGSMLTGPDATVTVAVTNTVPSKVRAATHVFQVRSTGNCFIPAYKNTPMYW